MTTKRILIDELKEGINALTAMRMLESEQGDEKKSTLNEYPEDYTGPRAGHSTQEQWISVRDYDAYKYVLNGVWSYADFDCYLYSMCEKHYELAKKRYIKK